MALVCAAATVQLRVCVCHSDPTGEGIISRNLLMDKTELCSVEGMKNYCRFDVRTQCFSRQDTEIEVTSTVPNTRYVALRLLNPMMTSFRPYSHVPS